MAAYTTIDDPSAYFKIQTYTGTGSSNAQTFADTDTDMQPDFVWIKQTDGTYYHVLADAVRGATKYLYSNATNAEADNSAFVASLNSDGFTVGSNGNTNESSSTYVAWCWKAGTTSGINATGADVTPEAYSFNQTAGFSIIDYHPTADTANQEVPHGLAAAPHFIIAKTTNSTQDWAVYHHKNTSSPETDYLELNNTQATTDSDAWWSDTAPTSVLFTVGTASETGGGNENIAYCWTGKQGYSKFGSYEGNSNANGPFVYTGFRPAYLMIKNIDRSEAWNCFDAKRNPYNLSDNPINLNDDAAEITSTSKSLDILSNGFKIRGTSTELNHSTLIYAAFAEAPFVNSNGVPCNAR